MARKLRTYRTSAGFFDLAVAAPSMKAALAAWGAGANLFHQGFASVTEDPAIVAATQAKPRVVLRRPVGSNAPFREQADLPNDLPVPPTRPRSKPVRPSTRPWATPRRDDALQARKLAQRQAAIDAAEAALVRAQGVHEARRSALDAERAAVDRRLTAEDERWRIERDRLEAKLKRARRSGLPPV